MRSQRNVDDQSSNYEPVPPSAGRPPGWTPRARKPKKPRKPTVRHPRAHKPKKPKKPPKPKQPKRWHEQPGQSGGKANSAITKAAPHGSEGSAVLELIGAAGLSLAASGGLGGYVLELVGEGRVALSSALAAYAREQDRLANSAWRRPGGLARMGGL